MPAATIAAVTPAATIAVAAPAATTRTVGAAERDDEEEESTGRLLSESEYTEVLKKPADIFTIEKDKRLRNMEIVCMLIGLLFGVWLSSVEAVKVATDYYTNKVLEPRTAKVLKASELPQNKKKEEEKKNRGKKKEEEKKKEIKPIRRKAITRKRPKPGSPAAAAIPRTPLPIRACLDPQRDGQGKDVADADIKGLGGFATNIDAILKGVGALKSGSAGGSGRMGAAGIGFGAGYGGGFGGGSGGGGVDDLMGA